MKSEDKLRKTRPEIFQSFYRTLKHLLDNDVQCRDKCNLITFNDSDCNGDQLDIGELLYRHLEDKITKTD